MKEGMNEGRNEARNECTNECMEESEWEREGMGCDGMGWDECIDVRTRMYGCMGVCVFVRIHFVILCNKTCLRFLQKAMRSLQCFAFPYLF